MQLTTSNIVNVPLCFQPKDLPTYPEDNNPPFEEWYFESFRMNPHPNNGRIYLPIFWTAYYKKHSYGKDIFGMAALQSYISALNPNNEYYTIVQYDDGILNDLLGLDIKVFCMNGNRMDYALPLICQPHKYTDSSVEKKIFMCFMAAATHPIRDRIFAMKPRKDYFIAQTKLPLKSYCNILSLSTFSLCPRGYGKSSFRIMESLQQGSIPVIISDDFASPHDLPLDWYTIKIQESEVDNVHEILSYISSFDIMRLQNAGKGVYEQFYTFESNRELILKNI